MSEILIKTFKGSLIEIPKEECYPSIVPEIIRAYKQHGFFQIHIIGKQRLGKTTYNMQSAYWVYRLLNPSWDEEKTWKTVLERTFFNVKPSISLLRQYNKEGKRVPCIIYDDIRLHLGKYTQFVRGGYNIIKAVVGMWDIIGSVCPAILISSPHLGAAKPIQESCWYKGKIFRINPDFNVALEETIRKMALDITTTHGEVWRMCKIWEYDEQVWGESWHQAVLEDFFPARLPDWVYKEYEEMRRVEVDKILEKVETTLTEKEQKALDEMQEEKIMHDALELRRQGLTYAEIAARLLGDGRKENLIRKIVKTAEYLEEKDSI